MASVYKRSSDKGRKGSCWYVAYTDHTGKRRTVRGFTEKNLTQQLAAQLEDEARKIRLGLIDVDEAEHANVQRQLFEDDLHEFEKHLRCRDITDKQVRETMMRVRALGKFAGFASAKEISETEVESFLAKLREDGRSKQTSNHYLKAIKLLCRWLVRTKRIRHNPVADITRLNVRTDQRHLRRALSAEELQLLVEAAQKGKTLECISGPDRAMMYVLAAWTGFRKSEIGSLTLSSFDLIGDPRTVTVEASFSKSKRRDIQVLHPGVADWLGQWISSKETGSRNKLLFPVSRKVPGGKERKTHKMMEHDLSVARGSWIAAVDDPKQRREHEESDFLKYRDSRDRFADFHANRHTFITNLGRTGASPRTIQQLARHSDIRLTLDVYSHAELAEKIEAVSRLPSPVPSRSDKRETGAQKTQAGDNSSKGVQRASSAAVAENGISRRELTPGGGEVYADTPTPESAELAVMSEFDATCPNVSSKKESTRDWIRTSNLRLRRPTRYPIAPRGLMGLSPVDLPA